MAYRIMKSLIANSSKSREELFSMADVYYGAGRLTEEQYREIVEMVEKKVQVLL